MSSKTEEYLALAQRTANGLTRYWESWTDYQGKLLSSAEGEHWLVHTANRYHFAYMSTANELLKQLMTIHAYDLIHQYAALALTIAPENTKAYYWLIQSYLKQNMEEMATGELVAARQKLPDEEYQKLLQELKK